MLLTHLKDIKECTGKQDGIPSKKGKKQDFITVVVVSEEEDSRVVGAVEPGDEIKPLEMVLTTDCPLFLPKDIESRTREDDESCVQINQEK